MTDFEQNIVYYRGKRKLSIESASTALGISAQRLTELESGKSNPTPDEILKFSKTYHISVKKLLKSRRKLLVYKVSKKKLVGFNRYGMKQGWSVIAVPIMAFIALCLMFIPGFLLKSGNTSLMQILFLANRADYMVFGGFIFAVMAFNIIYWAILLSLGHYARAKHKVLNNVILSVFSVLTLIISLAIVLMFRDIMMAVGYIADAVIFANAIVQVVILITINLEGGENSHSQVYTYHEFDRTGYDTRHWYTLGMTAFSLVALGLCFIVSYFGRIIVIEYNLSFIDAIFRSSNILVMFMGALALCVLAFNAVYWVIICCLPRDVRRKTAKANNVLITIMSIVLFIDTIAIFTHPDFVKMLNWGLLTDAGVALYVMLFVTAIYGLVTLPIINATKKRIYVRDANGLHRVKNVQGQRPGKILAYKLPTFAQIMLCLLLGATLGLSFLDSTLVYIAFVSGFALVFELISIIFQFIGRYVSVGMFAYSIILNTFIAVFAIFLLMLSIFGSMTLGARIAMPILGGFILFGYAYFVFFLKPIRDASRQL